MASERDRLARHLNALLAERLPQIPLDRALLASAQTALSRVSPAKRVYSRIASSEAAQAVPPWRPGDALGADGVSVFMRASGKPLTDGIPGFYTVDGFYKVLLPALGDATNQVASESWVLGSHFKFDPHDPKAKQLEHDVIGLYEDDYIKHWDEMLNDLSLVPLRNVEQGAKSLYILGSSPLSPIRKLLGAIAQQLKLTQPPPAPPAEAAKSVGENIAKLVAPDALARLKPVLGTQSPGPPPEPPGKKVDDHYRALLEFVGTGPGAQIDQALKVIDDLHQQIAARGAPAPGAPPGPAAASTGQDSVQLMRDEASRDPQPIRRWLEATAVSANALISGRARQQAAEAWNAPGSGPASLCQKAVTGRYPFVPGAPGDIPMDDFAKLFSPGGLIDGFFNTQLRPYVDTSGDGSWKPHPVDGVAAPVTPADLAQFQKAAVIRELFFAAGNAPSVRFDITPIDLDDAANQVTLDIGGTTVTYAHGPTRATQITWPGQAATGSARLVFDPRPSTGPAVFQASGAWALFRLFEQGTLKRTEWADRYELTFASGDRKARFEIRAGSVINPFAPGLLAGFQCPKL